MYLFLHKNTILSQGMWIFIWCLSFHWSMLYFVEAISLVFFAWLSRDVKLIFAVIVAIGKSHKDGVNLWNSV